jgi:hypothetical protein
VIFRLKYAYISVPILIAKSQDGVRVILYIVSLL